LFKTSSSVVWPLALKQAVGLARLFRGSPRFSCGSRLHH
jgi:hypothetical protein